MARDRSNTGGRGGEGPAEVSDFNLDDFVVIEKDSSQELSRSRTAPSKFQPLIDLARKNLSRKIERTQPVMDGEGNATGEREPMTYSREEAQAYVSELNNLRNRNKLPAKRLSLRIVSDPSIASMGDGDRTRVQFYIVGRKPTEETAEV